LQDYFSTVIQGWLTAKTSFLIYPAPKTKISTSIENSSYLSQFFLTCCPLFVVVRNPIGAAVLGRRLETLRKARAMSQQTLATEAEVGLATIKRIETAAVSPSVDVLISISHALGIHLYELVQDEMITNGDKEK
jgi:DNA-binding XRE family transcriptional regulator